MLSHCDGLLQCAAPHLCQPIFSAVQLSIHVAGRIVRCTALHCTIMQYALSLQQFASGLATVPEWYIRKAGSAVQVIDRSSTAHERHDFGDAGRMLYDFCWGEFADWYIEAAKARLYGQDPQAALQTRQVHASPFCSLPCPPLPASACGFWIKFPVAQLCC